MIQKITLFISMLLIVACQPSFDRTQFQAEPGRTGAETIIVKSKPSKPGEVEDIISVPYTTAGNIKPFEELKAQVKNIPTDPNLIENLRTIELDPMRYNHGANLTNTSGKPDVVVLNYKLKNNNSNILFTVPLEEKSIGFYKGIDSLVENNTHKLARATSENQKNYEVQLQCLDELCKSIKFVIVKKQNDNVISGVGVVYSQKKVPMSVDSSQAQKSFVQHLLTPSGKELLKRDYSIVNGPSFSEVWMNVQDNRVIYFKTDLAFTGYTEIPISNVFLSKPKKLGQRMEYHQESVASGNLIGNDEEHGDIWIQFKLNNEFYNITKTKRQNENAEFSITTGTIDSDESLQANKGILETPKSSYFNITNTDSKNMSNLLNKYKYSNSKISEYIKAYIGVYSGRYDGQYKTFHQDKCSGAAPKYKNLSANLQAFYNNLHPAKDLLQKQFEEVGVAPEFSLLMVLESSYPSNYKIQKAECKNRKCTAYGPFQVTNPTADTLINYAKIYGVSTSGLRSTKTPQANKSDFRNYLLPSAKMAAIYIKSFYKKMPNRPELYATAYNGGPGQVTNTKDKTPGSYDYLNFGNTSLEKLVKFKAAGACKVGYLDYGFKFLALKYITDEFEQYGFKLNPRSFSNFYQTMKLQPQSI